LLDVDPRPNKSHGAINARARARVLRWILPVGLKIPLAQRKLIKYGNYVFPSEMPAEFRIALGKQRETNNGFIFLQPPRYDRERETERERRREGGRVGRSKRENARVHARVHRPRMQRIAFCNGKCCVCSYRDCESRSSCPRFISRRLFPRKS